MNSTQPQLGIFSEAFPPMMDGVSLTVKNYADWLHKKGARTCVVTPDTPVLKDELPYQVHRYCSLPIPMRKPYRVGLPQLSLDFYKQINRMPFALLHTHSPFSSGELALRIARKQKVFMIYTQSLLPNYCIKTNIKMKHLTKFFLMLIFVGLTSCKTELTLLYELVVQSKTHQSRRPCFDVDSNPVNERS